MSPKHNVGEMWASLGKLETASYFVAMLHVESTFVSSAIILFIQ